MHYPLLRHFLFHLPPELAHSVALRSLSTLHRLHALPHFESAAKPKKIMGLTFANPVGLAAGLDKNGDHIDALGQLGFGFIEIGTVTPQPQAGNPKPRLFRLTEDNALINRLGFNNKGVAHLVTQAKARSYRGILGINIGKQKETPLELASQDYLNCLQQVYQHADYITVNISSPNTPGLRELQYDNYLDQLLATLKAEQNNLHQASGKYTPLVLKISPDLASEGITQIARSLLQHQLDGVIATNTTQARPQLISPQHCNESGGLSGAPLQQKSTTVIEQLRTVLPDDFPIIAAGGIMSAEDAKNKLAAGADLVQIYTGFIYHGPDLLQALLTRLH